MWPVSSQLMLLLLMFFGGTLGSTGGSIKMLRVLIILKSVRLLFYRATHRRGVFHVKLGKVTISIGVATYPDDASDAISLLGAADRALIQAKDAGKNKVQLA